MAPFRLRELADQREAIEAARKAAKRRLPLPGQPLPAAGGGEGTLHPDDWVVQARRLGGKEVPQPRCSQLLPPGLQAPAFGLQAGSACLSALRPPMPPNHH